MTAEDSSAREAFLDSILADFDDPAARASTEPELSPALSDRYGPYHESAAVLSVFDRDTLRPAIPEPGWLPDRKGLQAVLDDSRVVDDDNGQQRWSLVVEIRRAVLRQLGSLDRLKSALAVNADTRPSDPVQSMFEAYLAGAAPPVQDQTPEQLAATLEVLEWLSGLGLLDGLPDRETVLRRREFVELLQPFVALVSHFVGREDELAELRAYVGVQPPGSLRVQVKLAVRAVFNLKERPVVMIIGPGGIGKSTLLAKLILDHTTLAAAERFPWAYLDLDRPGLIPEEPLTLLIESVRQLGIQYPDAREYCDRVRRTWERELGLSLVETDAIDAEGRPVAPALKPTLLKTLAVEDSRRAAKSMDKDQLDVYLRDFSSLLSNIRTDACPFLLVLDTFEQVQYRSDLVVDNVCRFLQSLQQQVPQLCTIIAGRAELTGIPISPMELHEFRPTGAQQYLVSFGIAEPVARNLARQVGGNPLSLKLAAEVWRAEGGNQTAISDLRTRSLLGLRVLAHEIQGQLFTRILEHIHDRDVRKLAYTGLVLRRITPDLIQDVLAGPSGVTLRDPADAQRLFEELKREVALVAFRNGVLYLRPDVRKVMIHLVRSHDPLLALQINESAIAYYAQQRGIEERAEEIYHRLVIQESTDTVGTRWIRGVEPHLISALDELNVIERTWLASRLGMSLSAEERQLAGIEAWERDAEQRARELLVRGRVSEALAVLRERSERTPGSALYLVEAQAWEHLEEWAEAGRVVAEGIQSADAGTNREVAVDLRLRGARLAIRQDDLHTARQMLDEADSLVVHGNAIRAVELRIHLLAVERAAHDPTAADRHRESLATEFGVLSDGDIQRHPLLMGWVAQELQHRSDALKRILLLNGFATYQPARLRALALALAKWDREVSDINGEGSGVLAGRVGAEPRDSLTSTWTRFILTTPPAAVTTALALLLDGFPDPPTSVRRALVEVLRDDATEAFQPGEASVNVPVRAAAQHPAQVTPLRLSGHEAEQFVQALLDAFPTRSNLEQMLRFRLQRNLNALVLTDDLHTVMVRLVAIANNEGWTANLLAAALESVPRNLVLRDLGERYGLATTASPPLEQVVDARYGTFLDVAHWRTRLAFVETQVCRVEVGSDTFATGFLVGPDLVLTAYHVLESVIVGMQPAKHVTVRFDYKGLLDGLTISDGTVHSLATPGLVAWSPYNPSETEFDGPADLPSRNQLNYALVRLTGTPGTDPVGGASAEPDAPPRRWIEVPVSPPRIIPNSPLYILQHAKGQPLKLAMDARGILGLNANGTRVNYSTSTDYGSSGAPCFDANWRLIALHLGKRTLQPPALNYGVPIAAIVADLQERGLAELLRQRVP